MRRGRVGQQLHDGEGGNGFPRTGFANQGDALAGFDIERDRVDGQRLRFGRTEENRQIPDVDKRLIAGCYHADLCTLRIDEMTPRT